MRSAKLASERITPRLADVTILDSLSTPLE